MRSIRTKLLIAGVGAAALVLSSVGGAYATFGPGEVFGFVWTEYGAVEAQETVDLVAKQGKSLVTQRYIIPAGFSGLWPTHQGPNYIMHIRGSNLNAYENCAGEARVLEPGKGYYRDGSLSPQGMRVDNPNSDSAELIVVWLDVNPADPHNSLPWGSDELVRGACAAPASSPTYENGYSAGFEYYDYARGPAHTDIPWSHEQGLVVIAMHFLTAPQWHFNWHTHPPTFITNTRGNEREYIGCPEIIDWQPNVTYLHSPNNFGRPQERAKNISNDEATEFWVMFSKGPKERVRGSIPVTFTGPPNGCVTDGFLTNTNAG